MNRAERRRARVRVRRLKPNQGVSAAVACPDCTAVAAVVEVVPGYFRGTVTHDECCPFYAALERELE